MGDSASKDAAAKQRIIQHMNKDHQDSLVRYLEHFCHTSSFSARNAHLHDISFSSMTVLASNGSRYNVPIHPPLTSWSEARERVVAMDTESLTGLKRSKITVKKYKRPEGLWIIVPIVVASTLAAFARRSNFVPGFLFHDVLLKSVPNFAEFCYTIQPYLVASMIAIHGAEAAHMVSSRLERHSVPTFSLLWWKWVVGTFFEGVGSFIRFDKMVKEEEGRKAQAKH